MAEEDKALQWLFNVVHGLVLLLPRADTYYILAWDLVGCTSDVLVMREIMIFYLTNFCQGFVRVISLIEGYKSI